MIEGLFLGPYNDGDAPFLHLLGVERALNAGDAVLMFDALMHFRPWWAARVVLRVDGHRSLSLNTVDLSPSGLMREVRQLHQVAQLNTRLAADERSERSTAAMVAADPAGGQGSTNGADIPRTPDRPPARPRADDLMRYSNLITRIKNLCLGSRPDLAACILEVISRDAP